MNKLIYLGILLFMLLSCKTTNKKEETNSKNNVTAEKQTTWDNSYGGADKSYDTVLLELREEIAPRFKTLEFKDSITGRTMTYNLFIPKNYDKNKSYPLVQFIADASIVGKGAEAPLKQGYGAIIWATDESQSENPCFVLAPSFSGPDWAVNDNWETSDEVDVALRLLNTIISDYSIDKNRIYTTGQSMGGMISFYLNATHPDLFAASIFVGSQWDISVLQPLTKKHFFYLVSAGDEKASNGMQQVGDMLKQNGVSFGSTEFAATLSQAEQEKQIEDLISQGNDINFVRFTKGTVIPKNSTERASEHMYSFDYAYKLKGVRDWLFKQTRE